MAAVADEEAGLMEEDEKIGSSGGGSSNNGGMILQQRRIQEAPALDPNSARFPHCVVWTPLPIVSWLSPFIGHVGICKADGVILDFAGPYFVNVDSFAFGSAAKYVPLDPDECCFPPHLSAHRCKDGFRHSQLGTATSWDDALRTCMQKFQHKTYNFFTCNCHSFVSTCLNRAAYQGSISWNIIKLLTLIHSGRGRWVSKIAIAKSFAPFLIVICIGILSVGWPFLIGWAIISFLFLLWFIFATYCINGLIDC